MRTALSALLAAALVVGCSGSGPILANPPPPRPTVPPPSTAPAPAADPVPIVAAPRRRPARPPDRVVVLHRPPAWRRAERLADARVRVRHLPRGTRRSSRPRGRRTSRSPTRPATGSTTPSGRRSAPGVDRSPRTADGTPRGFDLVLTGADPHGPGDDRAATVADDRRGTAATTSRPRCRRPKPLSRACRACRSVSASGAGSRPRSTTATAGSTSGRPAAPYYYSRTAMDADGALTLGAVTYQVVGDAWFDHQWGDFISVGGGGWDWYAVNLEDGTDLTLSLVRDADGSYPLVYGTVVDPDGTTRHLDGGAFTVVPTGTWTSPTTGAAYPAGWLDLDPVRAARDRAPADGRRPGARHAGHDRGRVLGGVADGRRAARRDPAGGSGVRRADRLRADRAGALGVTSRERAAAARRRRWPRGHATRRRGR